MTDLWLLFGFIPPFPIPRGVVPRVFKQKDEVPTKRSDRIYVPDPPAKEYSDIMLNTIKTFGPMSRRAIEEATGMNKSMVRRGVYHLILNGIIEEGYFGGTRKALRAK